MVEVAGKIVEQSVSILIDPSVGVSGTSTWYNRRTSRNIKTSGLTATPGDRALCWVSNVHQHL